ncbi:MAG: hypothetical protein E7377_03910, partial [Clostridiales bacterium]|nr:hypothetical protein [Clostridiales bacterium]
MRGKKWRYCILTCGMAIMAVCMGLTLSLLGVAAEEETSKVEIAESVQVQGWVEKGTENMMRSTEIFFGEQVLAGISIDYKTLPQDTYAYIADYITINGETVSKINEETDVSGYRFDIFPANFNPKYQKAILICKTERTSDRLELLIHKDWLNGFSEPLELGIKEGLYFENNGSRYEVTEKITYRLHEGTWFNAVHHHTLSVYGENTYTLSLEYGEKIELETPIKEHYNFVKWVDENGETALTEMPNCDYDVYSMYAPKVYTVTFLYEGGEVVAVEEYTVEDTEILVPAVPEKEGYSGHWENYVLDGGNKTVSVVYTEIPSDPEDTPDEPTDPPSDPENTPDEPTDPPSDPENTPDEPTDP